MKNGNIGDFGVPSSEELELINQHTRRKFAADELYAFSVVLCDNDVDRDYERFSDSALEKLAELYVGKTGISDHSPKAENQCARIFYTKVEAVEGKITRVGEQYKRLFARAYMPKSEASEQLILAIESGIKKEVSVGCSMAAAYCSICGKPAGACQHKKGRTYRKNGQRALCYFELTEPTDAFEWSFVAVPAQPKAGVVKSFAGDGEITVGNLTKSVFDGEITISVEEAKALSKKFTELSNTADMAGEFLESRKAQIVKAFMPSAKDTATDIFMKALDRLEPCELFKLYTEIEDRTKTAKSQLSTAKGKTLNGEKNSFFII